MRQLSQLIRDLVPHAPQMGLFVAPDIPADRLRGAVSDYAASVNADDVLVLYDATLLGSGKDGAVFTSDRFVFQNNDLETPHDVRYADIVAVEEKRKLLGGRRVLVSVNRGRATFELTIDFSGRPEAAEYVARFLRESILHTHPDSEADSPRAADAATDVQKVRSALERLHADGDLSQDDLNALLAAIGLDS